MDLKEILLVLFGTLQFLLAAFTVYQQWYYGRRNGTIQVVYLMYHEANTCPAATRRSAAHD